MAEAHKTVANNKKAFHDYFIEDRYEAGMVLEGSEVKAIREGRAHIRESYCKVEGGQVFIHGMHVQPYSKISTHVKVDPVRPRKLLLHRDEIYKLQRATQEKGLTIVPLRIYFSRGMAKLEIGVAKGKKSHDRRQAISERDARREMDQVRRRFEKGS
jgi:SsrA-binding protein